MATGYRCTVMHARGVLDLRTGRHFMQRVSYLAEQHGAVGVLGIDLSGITAIDTSGAWQLVSLTKKLSGRLVLFGATDRVEGILEMIGAAGALRLTNTPDFNRQYRILQPVLAGTRLKLQ